jgi:hypothetical protein
MSIIFLCACGKCDCGETNNNQSTAPKDEYYVRYSCRTGGNAYSSVTMTYIDADGQPKTKTGRIVSGLSETIGPVSYGFKAGVSSNVNYSKIECSKNNGPFIVKRDKAGNYTIDF